MTEYYASPDGGGDGDYEDSPFVINDFWSVVRPGDTLCLVDGVFRGTDSMIHPPPGVSGTKDAPITIKALNDGQVFLDGEGSQNRVVWLDWSNRNDYFVIEGINAAHGLNYVVDASSQGNVFRRCIAWDAIQGDEGEQTWRSNGYNGLVEDCAAFGGRYAMGCNQLGNDAPSDPMTTFRRCLVVFTESTESSPKASIVYWYNSDPCRWENCVAIWDCLNAPNSQGLFYCATADPYVHGSRQTELLGCIAYVKAGYGAPAAISGFSAQGNRRITMENLLSVMSPNNPAPNLLSFDLRAASQTQGGSLDLYIKNSTGIGENPPNIHPDWIQENVKSGSSVESVYGSESLYVNDGSKGATICKRYKDGVLTSEGLFPLPINQRVIDAMTLSGRIPIDVTADLESVFGTIPDVCRWDTKTDEGGENVLELPQITDPVPGSVLLGSSVLFSWTKGVDVEEYWIDVGTTNVIIMDQGGDIVTMSCGLDQSVLVDNIPTNGTFVYVRLWSKIGGGWMFSDYQYTAASGENPEPPSPSSDWIQVMSWIRRSDIPPESS